MFSFLWNCPVCFFFCCSAVDCLHLHVHIITCCFNPHRMQTIDASYFSACLDVAWSVCLSVCHEHLHFSLSFCCSYGNEKRIRFECIGWKEMWIFGCIPGHFSYVVLRRMCMFLHKNSLLHILCNSRLPQRDPRDALHHRSNSLLKLCRIRFVAYNKLYSTNPQYPQRL